MDLTKYFENPKFVKKMKNVGKAALVLVVFLDLFSPRHPDHIHAETDKWFGFYAFYGFIACYLILVVSKFLGKVFLLKSEDYYD